MNVGEESRETQRLMTKIAWLYHHRGLRQGEIGARLGMSQSRVSRLLETATSSGIVRTVVMPPPGLFADLEGQLEEEYGLQEVQVFDVGTDDDRELTRQLGRALATVLQSRPLEAEVVGLTSWSRSLREMIDYLTPLRSSSVRYVAEVLGDVGPPELQHAATHATQRFAALTGATPMFLRVAGVAPTPETRTALLESNRHAQAVLSLLDEVDLVFVGIGTPEIVPPLTPGDNYFTEEQFAEVVAAGAVGQVDLRFIDVDGKPVTTSLDDVLVGITFDQLRAAPSRVGVAGGPEKYEAIRAALVGGWLTTFVTDVGTAEWLLANAPRTRQAVPRLAQARATPDTSAKQASAVRGARPPAFGRNTRTATATNRSRG